MTTRFTVATATQHIETIIIDLQNKVQNLDQSQCANEYKKLTEYCKQIGFNKNPNEINLKKYMEFYKTLNEGLIDGYHDFHQIKMLKSSLENGIHVCTKWTKEGKPIYPKNAISPCGFHPRSAVYIFNV